MTYFSFSNKFHSIPERLVCLVLEMLSLGEGKGEGLELRDTLSEPTANIGLEVMSIPLDAFEAEPCSLGSRDAQLT